MFSDNLPVHLVKSWPIDCCMFDDDLLSGPVPSIFSEKTEDTQAALEADPLKAHADILRIHKAFFMPELISMTEMASLFKKPRYLTINMNSYLYSSESPSYRNINFMINHCFRNGAAVFPFKKRKISSADLNNTITPPSPKRPRTSEATGTTYFNSFTVQACKFALCRDLVQRQF